MQLHCNTTQGSQGIAHYSPMSGIPRIVVSISFELSRLSGTTGLVPWQDKCSSLSLESTYNSHSSKRSPRNCHKNIPACSACNNQSTKPGAYYLNFQSWGRHKKLFIWIPAKAAIPLPDQPVCYLQQITLETLTICSRKTDYVTDSTGRKWTPLDRPRRSDAQQHLLLGLPLHSMSKHSSSLVLHLLME